MEIGDRKIIHISNDEKFINSAREQFETVVPNSNLFFVFTPNESYKLKHVTPENNVIKVLNNKESHLCMLSKIKKQDIVIFHSLTPHFYSFLLKLNKKNTVVWFCFGFEIYNDKNYFSINEVYAQLTKIKFIPLVKESLTKKIKNQLRPYVRYVKRKLYVIEESNEEYKKRVIERVDYLCSSYKEEFTIITNKIKQKKKEFNYWSYPLEKIVDITDLSFPSEKNILIGNSAVPTGNHLDVFVKVKLKKINQVTVPLSYGDEAYIKEMKRLGYDFFGNNFNPITEFMPLPLYNEIIKKNSIAIFYNARQQAIGNIIAMIWNGAKVYLNSKNTFYCFLNRNGFVIFDFDKDFNKSNSLELLAESEIAHNRKLLKALFLKNKLEDDLRNSLRIIFN